MATLNVFCASGGGSKGAFEGGALEALTEASIDLPALVGVSTGSIQAGFLSLAEPGIAAQGEQVGVLKNVWFGLSGPESIYSQPSPKLWNLGIALRIIRKRASLYGLEPFEALLEKHIQSPPQRAVRLGVVDLETSIFKGVAPKSAAELRKAIRASSAIPLFFPPVPPNLVDGGVRNIAPVHLAFELAAEVLKAQPSAYDGVRLFVVLAAPLAVASEPGPWAKRAVIDIGKRSLSIVEAENYEWDVKGAERVNWLVKFFKDHADLEPPPFVKGRLYADIVKIEPEREFYDSMTFDPKLIRKYWKHGYDRTKEALATGHSGT
jgi:predicted acylesterase/phospholipase RssA